MSMDVTGVSAQSERAPSPQKLLDSIIRVAVLRVRMTVGFVELSRFVVTVVVLRSEQPSHALRLFASMPSRLASANEAVVHI